MKKIFEIEIKSDKTPKSISVNSMYLNKKKSWRGRGRTLAPWARAYKNYIQQEIKEKCIREWIIMNKEDLLYLEIDLTLWVNNKWKNKIETWKRILDTDWLIKLPQDCLTWYIYKDDDQVMTPFVYPTNFYVWQWFNLKLKVFKWNEKEFNKKKEK